MRHVLLALTVSVLALLPACPGLADDPVTSTWLGGNGYWDDPAMWDTPDYPHNNGTTYNAVINATGDPYAIDITVDVAVNNLLLSSPSGSVHISGTILNLEESMVVDGSLSLERNHPDWAEVKFGYASTLEGTGEVVFNGDTTSPAYGFSQGDSLEFASECAIGPGITIRS